MRICTQLCNSIEHDHIHVMWMQAQHIACSTKESQPGWKGLRARANIWRRMRGYRSRVTTWYRSVLPQTIHFRFGRKLKNHGVTSTLCTLELLAPRLQSLGSRSATNLVYRQNAIISFFSRSITLIVTRLHGRDWVVTASNRRNR